MRVLFVARAIDGIAGGVERMISVVMNELVRKDYVISLLTWDQAGASSFYPMDEKITWHRLDMGNPLVKAGILLRIQRAKLVRKIVRRFRPDVIVCFQDGPFMAIRTFISGMNVPVIAAERNAPSRFDHTSAGRRRKLTYHAFRFAKRILIQSESYRRLYPNFLDDRIVTIPNPVFPASRLAKPGIAGQDGRFRILSVGRLGYQKNYPVLIEAFQHVARDFPEWDLLIIGEGEDRIQLEQMVLDKGLSNRVSMPGVINPIFDTYHSSQLFCLPSRWEGFPNAMAEAMAHGLPAVGFSRCAGVNDLIKSDENGMLAEGNGDPSTLAAILRTLMNSSERRESLGKKAVDSVKRYQPDSIFSLWRCTLTEAAAV